MPERDDQERADEPRFAGDGPTDHVRRRRRVSHSILEETAATRNLEVETRKLATITTTANVYGHLTNAVRGQAAERTDLILRRRRKVATA
jgi:hypothetical protein